MGDSVALAWLNFGWHLTTLTIHGTIVYLPTWTPYFTLKNQPNVGKYTSPMDGMGKIFQDHADLYYGLWMFIVACW